ncbi:MAG: hypothetical protein R2824_27305 [Saprospiraceae bacterium]|nr:hypothetical protein [Lewinella sp.]
MKNKYWIIILLAFLQVGILSGQTQKSLSLSWGTGNLKRQDLTFSNMIHESWSPVNALLEYRKSGKMEQSLLIGFSQYKAIIGEPFEYISFYDGADMTYPHSFLMIDLDSFASLHKIQVLLTVTDDC